MVEFRDNARTRIEFLELLKLSGAALNRREGVHSPMAGVLEE